MLLAACTWHGQPRCGLATDNKQWPLAQLPHLLSRSTPRDRHELLEVAANNSCRGPPSRLCTVSLLIQLRWPAHVAAQLSLPFIRPPKPEICRCKGSEGLQCGT